MNDLIILATLMEGPKYGYQLKREAGIIFGQGDLHNNLVYPLLRRFTESGWVTKKTVPGERGQTRIEYSLTAGGRKALLAQVCAYTEEDASQASSFLLRVGMFDFLRGPDRNRILSLREAYLRDRLQRFGAMEKHMDLGRYAASVVHHLADQIAHELKWIQELRQMSGTKLKQAATKHREERQ